MKKVIIVMMLLAITAPSFGQQIPPPPSLSKQDHLQKSKNQKTAAWILLGAGSASLITGLAIGLNENDLYGLFEEDKSTNGGPFIGLGGLSMLGSIPLFLASGKNKRRGMSLSFYMQKTPQLQNNKLVNQSIPSINLKLSL